MTRCRICARRGLAKCACWRRASPKVRAHLRVIGRKGARTAGDNKHREALKRWTAQAKGLTPAEFAFLVYRRGYSNGYKAGERHGLSTGYQRGFDTGTRQTRFERAMERSA